MNVNDPNTSSATPPSQSSVENTPSNRTGARVEPCEFESLLRRALEILDTRSRAATNNSNS
jgi:hypothetical protein